MVFFWYGRVQSSESDDELLKFAKRTWKILTANDTLPLLASIVLGTIFDTLNACSVDSWKRLARKIWIHERVYQDIHLAEHLSPALILADEG